MRTQTPKEKVKVRRSVRILKSVTSELDCLGEHDLAQAIIDALDTWEGDQLK